MRSAVRRMLRIGAKLLVVAAIAGGIFIYRTWFSGAGGERAIAAIGPVQAEIVGTGTLEARIQAAVSPRIAGRILRLHVDQGDRVRTGQLLCELEDGELQRELEVAEAKLAAAEAALARADADIVRAEAVTHQAKIELDRNGQMRSVNAASAFELDKSREQHKVAQAEETRARAAREEAYRQHIAAGKSLAFQRERLAETRLVSPFDALVIRREREPGDVVVPGSPVFQVISTDQLWVSAWVDESAIASIAPGRPARVVFRSEPGVSYEGEVARLSPLADRETREFLVDVTVKQLPPQWAVGQRAEVFIQGGRKDQALLVPQRMIQWKQGQPGVMVVDGRSTHWQAVTLGLRGGESVEVVKGLVEGQVIASLGQP